MIRRFQPTEEDFRKFIKIFYETDFSFELNKPSGEDRKYTNYFIPDYNYYCNMLVDGKSSYFAYTKRGIIIAGAEYRISNGEASIMHFTVLPKYQLKGNGSRFLKELENYFQSKDVKTISLFSFAFGAVCFWKKQGYKLMNIRYYKSL